MKNSNKITNTNSSNKTNSVELQNGIVVSGKGESEKFAAWAKKNAKNI